MIKKIKQKLLSLLKQKEVEERYIPVVTKLRDELGLVDYNKTPPPIEIYGGEVKVEGKIALHVGKSEYSLFLTIVGDGTPFPTINEGDKYFVKDTDFPFIGQAVIATLREEGWDILLARICYSCSSDDCYDCKKEKDVFAYAVKDGVNIKFIC